MPNSSAPKRQKKQTVSGEMLDLIETLYCTSDTLLDCRYENSAEAVARVHWARKRAQKCKEMESELVARTGQVVPIGGHVQNDTPQSERHHQAMDSSWILDVLDDLTQFASFQRLEETQLTLVEARKTVADQLG